MMFISEVLFVSESVVSRLHQQHRDKETPPLLAFPWFGAQFLSHAFLALERDRRFTHITRFLNLADLAPHVSGTGYTFFVPIDTAFEEIGLDKMPDNYLSTGDGLEILLNHFVKGRLYDRDLKDNLTLITLGNETIKVERRKEDVYINKAHIVESEVFVYNLGTMFYIDKVLFCKKIIPQHPNKMAPPEFAMTTPSRTTAAATTSSSTTMAPRTTAAGDETGNAITTASDGIKPVPATDSTMVTTEDVETVPEELSETGGSLPDVLFADAEIKSTDKETTTTAYVSNHPAEFATTIGDSLYDTHATAAPDADRSYETTAAAAAAVTATVANTLQV